MRRPKKIFAIGDIHGCGMELRALIEKLPIDDDSLVVFVGDYIDRGSESREVIDSILTLSQLCEVVTLMGNHEEMFIDFLNDPTSAEAGMFIYNGGSATLASYADDYGKFTIPDRHKAFLSNLKLFHQTDDYFFVHAGVPDVALEKIDESLYREELLWIRGTFHRSDFKWSKRIVHGHTPVAEVEITPKRINVDTGCVFDRMLSAIELPSQKIYSVPKKGLVEHIFLRDATSRRVAVRFKGAIPVTIFRGKEQFEFETLDYSEFGMFIRRTSPATQLVLNKDDIIEGEVGTRSDVIVQFKGKVVRVQKKDKDVCYGIMLLVRTPVSPLGEPSQEETRRA